MVKENNLISRRSARPNQIKRTLQRTIERRQQKAKPSLGPTRLASDNILSEDELSRGHNTGSVQGENESVRSTTVSPELSNRELELAPAIPDSHEDTLTATSRARLNSPEVRLRQSNSDSLKKKSYSVTLENRISDIERRYNDLERSIILASRARDHRSENIQHRKAISSLRARLERNQLLTKDYEALEADRLGFINISLGDQYAKLHSNIRDTSATICHLGRDGTLPKQRTGFSHLANNWATRISGCGLGSLLCHCEAAQIPKRLILVSLLTAGIFNLALEKVFPDILAAESPLLDQYRKHIETQSGWKALQQLDIISIKSLLSVKDVKKTILSEKSEWLSCLMLQNLSCFLPLESQDMTQRSSHSERETDTIGDMRTTFHHALTVKFELMLSVKRFKYLFFMPGTPFDAEKMEVVESQAGDSVLLSQNVKICLLPAFFTISEAGNESGVGEESSFSSNYRKAFEEVIEEDIESLVLVEKAIVFL